MTPLADNGFRGSLQRLVDHRLFLPVCFALFVGVRGLLLLIPVDPSSDAAWYYARALELLERGTFSENGIPTAYWPVGYPAFLAGLFYVTGPSVLVAKLANLCFSSASFITGIYVCRVMFQDERSARIAALLTAVYPNNAVYVASVLTEPLYTLLILGTFGLVLRSRSLSATLACGIFLGVATLVKTQTILLVPGLVFLADSAEWSKRSLARAFVRAVIVTVVAIATVLPWSLRNDRVFGELIFVSTNGGMSLLAGNNDSLVGDFSSNYGGEDPLMREAAFSVEDQVNADKRAKALATRWIKDHPGDFVRMIPQKLFRLWAIDGEGEWMYQAGSPVYPRHEAVFRAVRMANQAFYAMLLLLAAYGVFRLLRDGNTPRQLGGVFLIAFVSALCAVFSGQSRYHFPVMPFVIFLASTVLSAWIRPASRVVARTAFDRATVGRDQ